VARAGGRSWKRIGLVLGMSRQTAREQFGQQPTSKGKRARRIMRREAAVINQLSPVAPHQSPGHGIVEHFP
jgi:hypothetical protein